MRQKYQLACWMLEGDRNTSGEPPKFQWTWSHKPLTINWPVFALRWIQSRSQNLFLGFRAQAGEASAQKPRERSWELSCGDFLSLLALDCFLPCTYLQRFIFWKKWLEIGPELLRNNKVFTVLKNENFECYRKGKGPKGLVKKHDVTAAMLTTYKWLALFESQTNHQEVISVLCEMLSFVLPSKTCQLTMWENWLNMLL